MGRFAVNLVILPRSKVFLEVSEPFSSEKGSKPRGSDWSEATTHGEAVDWSAERD